MASHLSKDKGRRMSQLPPTPAFWALPVRSLCPLNKKRKGFRMRSARREIEKHHDVKCSA